MMANCGSGIPSFLLLRFIALFIWLLLPKGSHKIFANAWIQVPGTAHRYHPVHPLPAEAQPGFTEIPASQSGLFFTNTLAPATMVRNSNLVNGSGVALGDVTGDGLPDLVLCNLEGRNAVYKNLGDWRFVKHAPAAPIQLPSALTRGAALADADGDGDLDLFLTFNAMGSKFFLNDGQGSFHDATSSAGISSRNGSTTMALADVDGDGLLDLYVASFGEINVLRDGGVIRYRMENGRPVATGRFANRLKWMDGKIVELGEPDTLFINRGNGRFEPQPWSSSRFLDPAGNPMEAPWDFGLCVTMRDLNGDGAPDIYVCNDFQTPDRLWFNDGRGHFKLAPPETLRRVPYASMGMDAADLDRDGRLDLFVVEMLPSDPVARLRTAPGNQPAAPTPQRQNETLQIARNVLLWNRGDGTWAEIARFAGVEATDWSWMPVFLDVDLDGFEDLLVTNGHTQNVNDRDLMEGSVGGKRASLLDHQPLISRNFAFRNLGNRRFTNVSRKWGFDSTRLSQGIALGDLDSDGDFDLVINCLNQPALLYKNNSTAPRILVRLKGSPPNTRGIGSRVTIKVPGLPDQSQEILAGGRYLSSDEPARVFAVGSTTNWAQIEVRWRGGRVTRITNAPANTVWEISESEGSTGDARPSPIANPNPSPSNRPMFSDLRSRLQHDAAEEPFDDLLRQPSAPLRLDRSGGGIAVGDWNNDGVDDLLIAGGKGRSIDVIPAVPGGGLSRSGLTSILTNSQEDITALLHLRSRGRSCLVSALSNHESPAGTQSLVQLRSATAGGGATVVNLFSSAATIRSLAAADFDNDGLLDLFAGASSVPGRFPESGPSAVILGCLEARPRTKTLNCGKVSASLFADLNQDGRPELITAGLWEPIRIWSMVHGEITETTASLGIENSTGLWMAGGAGDFDGDGRTDLVLGGWGQNSEWLATMSSPLILAYGDFSGSGQMDLLIASPIDGTPGLIPHISLAEARSFIPWVREAFPTHSRYATAGLDSILASAPKPIQRIAAHHSSSTLLLNRGNRFDWRPLPAEAQWSPVRQIKAADLDGDGNQDLFLAQNFFSGRTDADRCDAGRGLYLRGLGNGEFVPWQSFQSGIAIDGEQAGAVLLDDDLDGRMDLAVTQVADSTVHLRNLNSRVCLRVGVDAGEANPDGIGAAIRWISSDGNFRGSIFEVHAGDGTSSDTKKLLIGRGDRQGGNLEIRWPGGRVSLHAVPADALEVQLISDPEPSLKLIRKLRQ